MRLLKDELKIAESKNTVISNNISVKELEQTVKILKDELKMSES